MKATLRKLWQIIRFPLAALALCGLYLGGIQMNNNFHTVVEGQVYRSNQPNEGDIQRYAKEHGIRTVINLRGENLHKEWYNIAAADAKEAGVKLVNFKMSAKRGLTPERSRELIEVMRKAEKPVLIHCKAGADRSGLAAALYLAAVEKQDVEVAERQLWPLYGHLPLPWTGAYAMDRSFEAFKPELELAAQ